MLSEKVELPPVEPTRNYTFEEAAPYFGRNVDERRVRRWVSEGKLTFTPLPGGRGRVINGQQILDYNAQFRDNRVA